MKKRLLSILLVLCMASGLLSACTTDTSMESPGTEPSDSPSAEPSEQTSAEPSESPGETPFVLPAPSPAQYPGRKDFVPPNVDDMSVYDTTAILTAWKTSDPAGLSEYDRAIYDAAKDVLGQILTESMSNYEKETQIYKWIVLNVNYDWTHKDILVETPRESYTPYGGLVNRVSVCLGYAATFQLLMDMAGVECITILGACRETEDHAWNMVRLDGTWCCVDATWDANTRERKFASVEDNPDSWYTRFYFNVTSDYMAGSDHQWDYNNVPEAVGQKIVPGSGQPSAVVAQYPGRKDFVQPNKDDMTVYDTTAILAAWKTGDPSGLSEYDRAIYDAAEDVLAQILTEGMSDFQKEQAIYTWVALNVNYDWTHQDIMLTTPRESYTPYGGLVNHVSVCLGYAATCQLLMNMAGLECITVLGASCGSTENHAWNMVNLDGTWYCTDVTWDANYRERGWYTGEGWWYNLMTSDYMAKTDHQWDYNNVPETVYGWTGEKWVMPWMQ